LGRVNTACEFASGPGFIGFSLLAAGLCDELRLVDSNPEAIEACQKTISENGLETRVKTYVSDVFGNVPASEKWDLIVSNPPHFDGILTRSRLDRLLIDPGLRIHRKFYASAAEHLAPGGSTLLVENNRGPDLAVWREMIRENKLRFVASIPCSPGVSRAVRYHAWSLVHLLRIDPVSFFTYYSRQRCGLNKMRVLNIFRYPFYFVWCKKG
jgi:methylase of polypeptide subunit release factors